MAPLHPALVHFPIAFLMLAYTLDIIQPVRNQLPAAIEATLPASLELQRISYYALSLGLASSIPAVLSGAAQAVQAVAAGGLWEKGGGLRPKVATLGLHAALSDVVLGASAWVWRGRSRYDVAIIKPDWERAAIGAALAAGLFLSASLGGKLTYGHGMGIGGGSGKKKSA